MKRSSLKAILVLDLAALILSFGPGLFALSSAAAIFNAWSNNVWLAVPFSLLVLVAGFLSSVCILRLSLPSLKAGVFDAGLNRGFVAWQLHTALSRSAHLFGIHKALQATYVTRFFYWRAMGVRTSLRTHSSINVLIHDAGLVTIGEGCVLAEDVEISCHKFTGDRLFIAPVVIGGGSFVGRNTIIGPRVKIGSNSWIGANQELTRVQLSEGSKYPAPKTPEKKDETCAS